jgi:hypothetical protein
VGQYNKSEHSKSNHNLILSDGWKENKYWNMSDEFEMKALGAGRVWRV